MLPLFAYFALSLSRAAMPHAAAVSPTTHRAGAIDLRYSRSMSAPAVNRHAPLLSAQAIDEANGLIDLKEAAFGVLDRNAPLLGRYARGPVVALPLFARTATGDTAYGAAVSLRMP